jgi:hypothetical protein
VNGFYAVLAVVPMVAIPLLMGGGTVGQFWRMALVALNTLFFSLSVGILVSSFSRDPRQAAGLTFLALVTVTGLLPACGAWLAYVRKLPRLAECFTSSVQLIRPSTLSLHASEVLASLG